MTAEAMTAESAFETPRIPWWLVLLQGIALLILGFFLLTKPIGTTFIAVQFLGIYWLIGGIFGIVSIFVDRTGWGWKLFSGILGILAGVLIIEHPYWSAILVPATIALLIGIQGIIVGCIALYQAFKGAGWGTGILGVISIIFGLLISFNLLPATLSLPFVLGIFALIGGISAIVTAFKLK